MPEESPEEFRPTAIWTSESTPKQLDEVIVRVRNEMNGENAGQLIYSLKSKVKHDNGIAYAVLDGDKPNEHSSEEGIVYFDSISVGASANRLIKADFIRRVAEKSGVTDSEGKFKPVIFLASPGPGSTVPLTIREKNLVKKGDLGPVAKNLLGVVKRKEFGRVVLVGFSLGGAVGLSAASRGKGADLDINAGAFGDIPTVENRIHWSNVPLTIFKDFAAARDLSSELEATELKAQSKPVMTVDGLRLIAGFLKPINWRIANGLSHDTFLSEAQAALDHGELEKLTIAYSDTAITKAGAIEPYLLQLHSLDRDGILSSIKIPGKDHTWGDNLPLMAKLYATAMV